MEGFRKQLLELDSSGLAKKQVSTELQIQNQLQKFHRAYNSLQQLSSEKLDSHLILEKEQVKKLRKQNFEEEQNNLNGFRKERPVCSWL